MLVSALLCLVGAGPALAEEPKATAPEGADGTDMPAPAPETGGATAQGPSQQACLEAHGKAQSLKRETKFIEAGEQLLICSSATCPGMVIADCGDWIGELDRRTPSLAFSIKLDGTEASSGQVTLDGTPVTDRAQVVKVNPGRHVVGVDLAPFPHREEVVFARDGAGTQVVRIEFKTQPEPAPVAAVPAAAPTSGPPSDSLERPVPTLFYPLAGVAVAGLASFGVFSFIGNKRQSELEDECKPDCTDDQLKPMKTAYLIGDISLAVGAASLVGAAITYWTRPARTTPEEASWSLKVEPTLTAHSTGLGISAVQTW